MNFTILYRHKQRPDEAGITLFPHQARAAEMKDQLENRGFLIIKIAAAPFAKTHDQHQSDWPRGAIR